jgi:hypothetical protein
MKSKRHHPESTNRKDESAGRAPSGQEAHAEVMRLDAIRRKQKYQPGWLYHRCKAKNLLGALDDLRAKRLTVRDRRTRKKPCPFPPSPPSSPRLSLELVPATCSHSNVKNHVSRADWRKLQAITFKQAEGRCEICRGKGRKGRGLHCHEVWHYDDSSLVQKLLGLMALCPSCHEAKHMGRARATGRGRRAQRHLARVNGWTVKAASAYFEKESEICLRRSECEWRLDLTWLSPFEITINLWRTRKPVRAKRKRRTLKALRQANPA